MASAAAEPLHHQNGIATEHEHARGLSASAQTFTPSFGNAPHGFEQPAYAMHPAGYVQHDASMYVGGMPPMPFYYPYDPFQPQQPQQQAPFFDPAVDSPFVNGMLDGPLNGMPHPSMNPLAASFSPVFAQNKVPFRHDPSSHAESNGYLVSNQPAPLADLPVNGQKKRPSEKSYASMAAKSVSKPPPPHKIPSPPLHKDKIPGLPCPKDKPSKAQKAAARKLATRETSPIQNSTHDSHVEHRIRPLTNGHDDGWQIAGKKGAHAPVAREELRSVEPVLPHEAATELLEGKIELLNGQALDEEAPVAVVEAKEDIEQPPTEPYAASAVDAVSPGSDTAQGERELEVAAGSSSSEEVPVESEQEPPVIEDSSSGSDDVPAVETEPSAAVPPASEPLQALSSASLTEQPSFDAQSQIEPEVTSSSSPVDSEALTPQVQEPSQVASPSQTTEVFEAPSEEPSSPLPPSSEVSQASTPSSLEELSRQTTPRASHFESSQPGLSSILAPIGSEAVAPLGDAAEQGRGFSAFASSSKHPLMQSTSSIPRSSQHGDLSRYSLIDDEDEEETKEQKEPPPKRNADEPPSLTMTIFSRSVSLRDRFLAILGSVGINIVLPFVNGVMLGFGEIFAREYAALWFNIGPAAHRIRGPPGTASTASVGLRGSRRTGDMPSHPMAKTAAEAAADAAKSAMGR